ncbi:MAG: dihydroorotate dehydrogenase-like protein [Pirellulaceae bacterium]|nr:dihydroorotate dehydrogenase-like protein [Pirellulaceae bacterium]
MSVDLSTRYLGLELKNPLVASAGPLTGDLETLFRLEQAGVAAAVLPSLFEEQIEHDEREIHRLYEYQTESFAESLSYFPEVADTRVGPDGYLNQVERARKSLSIPVIASLNGHSEGGWTRYARAIQDAGASALELNIYFVPTDPDMTAQELEERYLDLVAAVRSTVSIPLAVKIGPQFSCLPNFARRLVESGADGLVLFNRYLEPDIDLERLEVVPHLVLSTRFELGAPLRWIAILREHLTASLAASSGVHQPDDALKLLLAGADVVMMTSGLLRRGSAYAATMLDGIRHWLEEKEYQSVAQMRGSMSRKNCPDPAALERANYMKALASYTAPLDAGPA